ncbi:hypothetical protein IV203_010747 [Nitzschia inconspicua]|uniref:Uncharacterized protein n=1 Tax=Nitzschia inconspicua TaxID=303405 RepID=A0A9K3PL33_9STRA|nr:hypothetical protein IV203_010747 [Nitzschia inconspicua]
MSTYYNGNYTSSTSEGSDSDDENRRVPGNQWLQRSPRAHHNSRSKTTMRCPRQEHDHDDSEEDEDDEAGFRPTLRRQKSYNKNREHRPYRPPRSVVSYADGRHDDHNVRAPPRSRSHQPEAPRRRVSSSKKIHSQPQENSYERHAYYAPPRRSSSTFRTINHAGQIQSGTHHIHARPKDQVRFRSNSLSHPRPPQRASSLPTASSRKNTHNSMMQDVGPAQGKHASNCKKKQQHPGQSKPKRHHSTFTPKRSKSIHRAFQNQSHSSEGMDDIWVQRVVMGGPNGPRTYFKSLYSGESRTEPPTGATAIVYIDDIVEQHKPSQKRNSTKRAGAPNNDGDIPTLKTGQRNETDVNKPKKRSSIFSLFLRTGKDKK